MSFQFSDDQVFSWMENSLNNYKDLFSQNNINPQETFMDKVDPFFTMMKMIALGLNKDQLISPIPINKSDKSYLNFHGKQWENLVLLKDEHWEEPPRLLDVAKKDKSLVVEIKNKHNTVKKSDLKDIYDNMKICLEEDGYELSIYTYMVPLNAVRVNKLFTPSDNQSGTRRPSNQNIIEMDGATFFNQYIFEHENGFSNFIDQMLEVSFKFSDIFKSNKNSDFLSELRGLYNL